MRRHRVIVSEDLADAPAAWLAERVDLVHCHFDDPAFPGHLADAEGLIVRTYTQVDASMLQAAPRLRVVGRAGVGVDNIDLPGCWSRGIPVVYTPDANTQAVVEYVVCLLADALRPRLTVDGPVDPAQFIAVR